VQTFIDSSGDSLGFPAINTLHAMPNFTLLVIQLTGNIGKSKSFSLPVKLKSYESLVISSLMYGAELWPLQLYRRKLEAAHHKFSEDCQ